DHDHTNMIGVASIASPSLNGLPLGPFTVRVYGVTCVLGLLTAMTITARRWRRVGGDAELVREATLWGFPAGLLGARLYHVVTSWNEVPHHWWGPFAIWQGGLGIWGGIACGFLAGWIVVRRRGASTALFADALVPAVLVGQSIGRVGNYFNQELFGAPSTLPWALRVAPADRPPGYERYATFHPTFLYEIVWNLLLAGLLVWLRSRGRVRPWGLLALYVAGYSLGRVWEELLRIDPSRYLLGMRLNFWVACALCLVGSVWFAYTQDLARRLAVRMRAPAAP